METLNTSQTVRPNVISSIRLLIKRIGFHDPELYSGFTYFDIGNESIEPLIKVGPKIKGLLIPANWWYPLPGNVVALELHDGKRFFGILGDTGSQYELTPSSRSTQSKRVNKNFVANLYAIETRPDHTGYNPQKTGHFVHNYIELGSTNMLFEVMVFISMHWLIYEETPEETINMLDQKIDDFIAIVKGYNANSLFTDIAADRKEINDFLQTTYPQLIMAAVDKHRPRLEECIQRIDNHLNQQIVGQPRTSKLRENQDARGKRERLVLEYDKCLRRGRTHTQAIDYLVILFKADYNPGNHDNRRKQIAKIIKNRTMKNNK